MSRFTYIIKTGLFVVAAIFFAGTTATAQMYEKKPDNIKTNYDDATLQKFVNVNIAMGTEQVNTKNKINTILSESSLSKEQFNKMFGSLKIGDTISYGGASKADIAEFKKTSKKVFAAQEAFADKMKIAIRREGLQLVEFNQITMAYENDKALKARLDVMFQQAMK